jgi:hypothetical protein
MCLHQQPPAEHHSKPIDTNNSPQIGRPDPTDRAGTPPLWLLYIVRPSLHKKTYIFFHFIWFCTHPPCIHVQWPDGSFCFDQQHAPPFCACTCMHVENLRRCRTCWPEYARASDIVRVYCKTRKQDTNSKNSANEAPHLAFRLRQTRRRVQAAQPQLAPTARIAKTRRAQSAARE